MKKKMLIMCIALVLTIVFTGCGANTENGSSSSAEEADSGQIEASADDFNGEVNNMESADTAIEANGEAISNAEENTESVSSEEAIKNSEEEIGMIEQRNSFSMMYYLAITAEEIRTSKDNRLALEDIYTSLLNDINPGSVDEITQEHLKNLRDIIKSYLNISTKRERLQFVYNQEKAAAMRSAVPNPLAILSVTNALDWKKLAMSVAYTAVDSYNRYKGASESADMAFIMSGWELDDEEKETVMKNRDRAFDYMVDMVQEYNLDGMKTLNEKAIERFAEICATENDSERIKLLRAEEEKYSLLSNYWLELADGYFETSQYAKCLECVEEYNKLSTGIYRQDFNYLKFLPKAIVAAQQTYTGNEYINKITQLADDITANTSIDDWSARYFAAQVYLELYSKTGSQAYLDKAYKIASENVTILLKEQRSINNAYLSDVVEQAAVEPDYRYMTESEKKKAKAEYKEEKKRVKEYNKSLKENRKTELPALYEPLVLNCELLFALADKMDIDSLEKAEIEAILETANNGIFLVKPINNAYSFTNAMIPNTIEMSKKEIIIPADLLTVNSKITVIVNENGKTTAFDDCVIEKVEREGSTVDTFMTHVSSELLKDYQWTANSKITVFITYNDAYDKTANFEFAVGSIEEHWYGDKVEFNAQ